MASGHARRQGRALSPRRKPAEKAQERSGESASFARVLNEVNRSSSVPGLSVSGVSPRDLLAFYDQNLEASRQHRRTRPWISLSCCWPWSHIRRYKIHPAAARIESHRPCTLLRRHCLHYLVVGVFSVDHRQRSVAIRAERQPIL